MTVGVKSENAVVLGRHKKDVVVEAVRHEQVADIKRLRVNIAIDTNTKELAKGVNRNVGWRQNDLVRLDTALSIIVMPGKDVLTLHWRNKEYCQKGAKSAPKGRT